MLYTTLRTYICQYIFIFDTRGRDGISNGKESKSSESVCI